LILTAMNYFVFFCAFVAFLATFLLIPWAIKFLKRIGLEVKDQNKARLPLVPLSGGIAVLVGIYAGFFTFIFLRKFIFGASFYSISLEPSNLALLFAAMISLFIVTFVGFIDDLIVHKSRDRSGGLAQWQKPLLTLAAAVPLMVMKAGYTTMYFPFLGAVNLGIIYPLILIPIGVVGAANMVNMLAGFNGMEAGMGIVYFGMLGFYAYVNESYLAALIALFIFSALIAFYWFNKFPAKIFPGDSLTYLMGGGLAIIAIIGNIEKAALIVSIPFFIELVLKARGKFKVQTYGYEKNGKIFSRSGNKVYSIPHILTRTGKFSERQITYAMIFMELVFASLIWFI
jgi:UDP-N-acetylglucosamine--dolichyl-phosphate N-acetylglucosaminephosphotransferase